MMTPSLTPIDAPGVPTPPRKSHPVFWASMSLLLIMLVGGFLRYWRLDHQAFWTDEAATINRIRGSLDDMARALSDQGFPPGWYVLLRSYALTLEGWLKNPADAWSAGVLRALPAFFGTMMIPAMYFLARQFMDRRGALLVALITAVNPYLIYYSRDLKMYGACWMLITLHAALFFHWQFNGKQWLYYPLMVLTGAAATALHGLAWVVIGLELLWLFVRPRLRPLDGVLWALGLTLMSLFPAWWYINKTRWMTVAVEKARFQGLEWITQYTDMTWQTFTGLPVVHLFGFLWPDYPPSDRVRGWFSLGADFNEHLATRSWPWMAQLELIAAIGLLAILFVGLIPWRKIIAWWRGRKYPPSDCKSTPIHFAFVIFTWITIPVLIMALTWLQSDSVWYGRIWGNTKINPVWEPRYLGVLIPAWTLWLVAALRRLPFFYFRVTLAILVVAVATASALSNHFLYRQHPWHVIAEVAKQTKSELPETNLPHDPLMVIMPRAQWSGESALYTFMDAFNVRPPAYPEWPNWRKLDLSVRILNDGDYVKTIERVKNNRRVRAIVVTDRLGDLNDGDLTNEKMQELLGPEWQLVHEVASPLNYEWRFYFYHCWRTRAWVRPLPVPASAPARKPATAPATRPANTRPATQPATSGTRPTTQPGSRPAGTLPAAAKIDAIRPVVAVPTGVSTSQPVATRLAPPASSQPSAGPTTFPVLPSGTRPAS